MSRKKRPVIAIGIDGDRREYDSVWEAHEAGFHYPKIYRCLKKHGQTHKGYHWRRPAEGKQAEPPNLEEALAWIAHATKVFSELAGGGDDVLTRRGDDFRADIHICRSRILSALTSSPGKDGGQEVEAVAWSERENAFTDFWEQCPKLVDASDVGKARQAFMAGMDAASFFDGPATNAAIDAVANFLKERDEAVLPDEIDDDEREASARCILRVIGKASSQPASTALVERITPHEFAQEYEFRGDTDYAPNDGERTMIEDAITGYLSSTQTASTALVERLTSALQPFAQAADDIERTYGNDLPEWQIQFPQLPMSDFRRARSALSSAQSTSREGESK